MNNMSNSSTEDLSCSLFASDQYIAVTLLSACTGAVSVVASLFVIVGILVSKKYHFFIQRLILYLSIAVFLNSISVVLRLQRTATLGGRSASHLQPLCVITSFVDQTTSWSALIAICCITCCLVLNVVLLRSVETLEKVYVFLIFVFPLCFNWIPFIEESYGVAGSWCWIRNKDEDCNEFLFGNYLRFILWYIPLYVVLFILLTTYVFIVCRIRRLRQHWEGKFDPESKRKRKKMLKDFRPLIWYPLIYLLLNIFPLMNRIHDAFVSEPSLTLWVLHALFSPLRGGFIALAYALDGQTVRRMLKSSMICTLFRRGGARRHVREYPTTRGHSDSYVVKAEEREEEWEESKNDLSSSVEDNKEHLGEDLPTQVALSVVESGSGSPDNKELDYENVDNGVCTATI